MQVGIAAAVQRIIDGNPCVFNKWLVKGAQFITALPSLFGLIIALALIVGSVSFFKKIFNNIRQVNSYFVALAISAILIPLMLVKSISNPNLGNISSVYGLANLILFPPQGKFLLPVVTLAVFWGPLVLVLILYWKAIAVRARKLGPGVVAVISISLILGLANEPRFLTTGWPFLVLIVVMALEESRTTASFKYVLGALTVIYAQFWICLNIVPWLPPDEEGLLDFPKQLYFMHYGLWMSWPSYVIQFILLVVSAIGLKKSIVKIPE